MRNALSAIFRTLIHPLVSFPPSYYMGMVLVRTSRTFRKFFYSPAIKKELQEIRFAGGLRMIVDRNSYMGGSIYWSGFHHLNELLYLKSRLKPGMLFIDIGANQGEFSIYAASLNSPGKVMAFEPVSTNRELLLQNIYVNNFQNVEVYDFGLSNQSGSLPIFTSSATELHHGFHEGLSTLFPSGDRIVQEEIVSLKVFDEEFFPVMTRMDVVKIDVEGAELFVLQGMRKSLGKFKPELMIEINNETFESAGYTSSDIMGFLSELGYKPYGIQRGKLKKLPEGKIASWGNYIFRSEQ